MNYTDPTHHYITLIFIFFILIPAFIATLVMVNKTPSTSFEEKHITLTCFKK